MPLFQCQICHSKILENRLQKHHAKVHASIDHDIYIPLTTIDTPQVALENSFEHITPVDEKLAHVSCTICGNRMPAESLDQHMKRKHNDVGDQVDAIGTKVNSMSMDVFETSQESSLTSSTVNNPTIHPPKQSQEQTAAATAAWMTTNWPKAKNPFSKSFHFTAIPKVDASTTTMDDSQPFYTIRVSVAQMKQLMNENRIDPKDGHFYLK